jgi:hypothetical protein
MNFAFFRPKRCPSVNSAFVETVVVVVEVSLAVVEVVVGIVGALVQFFVNLG